MKRNQSSTPQILLIALFASYFILVEYLLISKISASSLTSIEYVAIAVISILNLIPAGIFAFAILSVLPVGTVPNTREKHLLPASRFKPRVAVLYATYNDFMPTHARYDFEQAQSGGLAFFILDDSNDLSKRSEIEKFSARHQCALVRRHSREGYKAGAINHWIELYGDSFDYFFILDSDSRASIDSIQCCAELVRRNQRISVVQTKTLTMTSNPSRLTRSSVTIQHAYMEIVQKAMQKLGTTPYYGHNALVSIYAIREIGGFVEESNEDYKTLARLHNRGFESIYAEQAITWEEVPPDYLSSRKRSLRWSRDAVSQLGLLKYRNPLAIAFFLFYGWVTHMSNLVLLILLFLTTSIALPNLFSNTSTDVAGVIALTVIFLWPLVALRTKDPELKSDKMLRALLWGSIYNIPMMAPLGLQILKTSIQKAEIKLCQILGFRLELKQDFVVTPKTKNTNRNLSSIFRSLKTETSFGIILIIVAAASDHVFSLVYAAPQVVASFAVPFLVYAESRNLTSLEVKSSDDKALVPEQVFLVSGPRDIYGTLAPFPTLVRFN